MSDVRGQKTGAGRAKSFEDLEVFKRAYRISLELHRVSLKFPSIEQRALADQLRRSSKSVCANVAEGFAKQTISLAEEAVWQQWREEYREISRMLQGLHRRAGSKNASGI